VAIYKNTLYHAFDNFVRSPIVQETIIYNYNTLFEHKSIRLSTQTRDIISITNWYIAFIIYYRRVKT